MFDRIRCEVPLPDGWEPDELQTKDFDCTLSENIIRSDGQLILIGYDGIPYESNYHGQVNFYGIDPKTHEWHEYYARFNYGKLVTIQCRKHG